MRFYNRSMLQKYSICSHYSNRKKNSCKSASILPIQPGSEASEAKKLHFCRNFLIMSEKPGKKLHFCRIPSNQRSITQKSSIYLHSTSIPPYPPYDPTLPHPYRFRKETNSHRPTPVPHPQRDQLVAQHSYRFRKETNSSPRTHSAIPLIRRHKKSPRPTIRRPRLFYPVMSNGRLTPPTKRIR